MSDNKWETQPRLENGEFTFRDKVDFWKGILQIIQENSSKDSIAHTTKGGSYGELRKTTKGNKNVEIHHMPADSISLLSRWKGPCIIMSKEDHSKTSSYRNKTRAAMYRKLQKNLIQKGRFLDAEIMDIKDVIMKTGGKYTRSIIQKLDYDLKLYEGGKING